MRPSAETIQRAAKSGKRLFRRERGRAAMQQDMEVVHAALRSRQGWWRPMNLWRKVMPTFGRSNRAQFHRVLDRLEELGAAKTRRVGLKKVRREYRVVRGVDQLPWQYRFPPILDPARSRAMKMAGLRHVLRQLKQGQKLSARDAGRLGWHLASEMHRDLQYEISTAAFPLPDFPAGAEPPELGRLRGELLHFLARKQPDAVGTALEAFAKEVASLEKPEDDPWERERRDAVAEFTSSLPEPIQEQIWATHAAKLHQMLEENQPGPPELVTPELPQRRPYRHRPRLLKVLEWGPDVVEREAQARHASAISSAAVGRRRERVRNTQERGQFPSEGVLATIAKEWLTMPWEDLVEAVEAWNRRQPRFVEGRRAYVAKLQAVGWLPQRHGLPKGWESLPWPDLVEEFAASRRRAEAEEMRQELRRLRDERKDPA